MIDKLLTKLLCIIGGLYLRRKVKQYITLKKGANRMKITSIMKGFSLDIKVVEPANTTEKRVRSMLLGEPVTETTIEKTNFNQVGNITFKIDEATSEIEGEKDEFVELEKLAQTGCKDFNDNMLKPFFNGLNKYADRLMGIFEKEQDVKLQQNTARFHAEMAGTTETKA